MHLSRDLTHVAGKFGGSAKPAVDLIVLFNKRISTIDQAMATSSATVATHSVTANWTANLDARGLYYEGLEEDIDTLLEMHTLCTVTTYNGTRRSRRQAQSTIMSSDENSEQIQKEEEKTRRGEDEENVSNKTNNY